MRYYGGYFGKALVTGGGIGPCLVTTVRLSTISRTLRYYATYFLAEERADLIHPPPPLCSLL